MKHPIRWAVFALLLVFVWLLRPFFQPLVMAFVARPLRFVFIVVFIYSVWRLASLARGQINKGGRRSSPQAIRAEGWKAIAYVVAIMLLLVPLGLESEIRYTIAARTTEYEHRSDLPTFDPLRLTPKAVVKRYADDTFQNPQEYLGDSQIVLVDGRLKRALPRLPDGALLYFLKKLNGFVTVDVDTLERHVRIENAEFKYAEGIGVFDNIFFQLPLKRYFVTYSSEPIYLKNSEGVWITVLPYISYRGFVFRLPYWAGVMVIHQDGTIEDFSPGEAAKLSYLKGNRIHPKEIVRFYSNAYAYKGGLLNKWFLHKNQTEVVSLPGDEDVFHVPTTEGFKQIVVAEPYGRSYGIYKIFMFDATTGRRELIEYDEASQLTGPVRAADYIKKEFPTYDWNVFSLSEPRPIKISGDLYWLLSIIPRDAAGIASTVLLNTRTNTVVNTKTESELRTFIAAGIPPQEENTGDSRIEAERKIEEIERLLQEVKKLLH